MSLEGSGARVKARAGCLPFHALKFAKPKAGETTHRLQNISNMVTGTGEKCDCSTAEARQSLTEDILCLSCSLVRQQSIILE